jgi:plasmid maintenance system antidote protein VapI
MTNGLSINRLARDIVAPGRISAIINGKRSLPPIPHCG